MKDCFCCCLISMAIGGVVGGLLVASNKKVENTLKKGVDMAADSIENIKEKIEDAKSKKSNNSKN